MQPKLVLSGLSLGNPFVGQSVYALRIIEGLLRRRDGFPFQVIAPAAYSEIKQLVPPEHLILLDGRPPLPHELIANIYWANRAASYVRKHHPDALFHSPSPIWARHQPAQTVVTLHDCIYRHFRNYLGKWFIRRQLVEATERFAARARLVLTDSEFSKQDLMEHSPVPPENMRVLYPWVDERSFEPISESTLVALRAKLRLPERFWLYLGGYDYRKNVEFLVAAYADARRESSHIPPLVLAGRIPAPGKNPVHCDVHGAIREASLPADAVLMPGVINHADLPGLYRLASLLVYPSLMEGFGLPPAEAMAVGTPVLASNTSSLPEVVREARCRFDPSSPEDLRARLLDAARDTAEFHCALPHEFTERSGLARYLELLGLGSPSSPAP